MSLNKTQLREIARRLKVSDHADYQTYLSLIYSEAKLQDPSYSFVRMSEDLGIGSTNAHSVISGRRPLTVKSATKICDALGLTGTQKRYFLTLVREKRAKSLAQSEEAFDERLRLKQKELPTALDRRQLEFFEHWHHAAVLETLRLEGASDDAQWIAGQLNPRIPLAQVEDSLQLLKKLGYVKRDATRKRLYPTEVTITTGNEVLGLALHSFHRQMLKLSLLAIESVAAKDRDISAVTITVSPALREKLKEETIALRKKYLRLAAEEQDSATEVVQLNIQLFPIVQTSTAKKGGKS